jgi:hypothetical protein
MAQTIHKSKKSGLRVERHSASETSMVCNTRIELHKHDIGSCHLQNNWREGTCNKGTHLDHLHLRVKNSSNKGQGLEIILVGHRAPAADGHLGDLRLGAATPRSSRPDDLCVMVPRLT